MNGQVGGRLCECMGTCIGGEWVHVGGRIGMWMDGSVGGWMGRWGVWVGE